MRFPAIGVSFSSESDSQSEKTAWSFASKLYLLAESVGGGADGGELTGSAVAGSAVAGLTGSPLNTFFSPKKC